jgi:hypothetical protein
MQSDRFGATPSPKAWAGHSRSRALPRRERSSQPERQHVLGQHARQHVPNRSESIQRGATRDVLLLRWNDLSSPTQTF